MHSHDTAPSLHLDRSHLADEESLLTEFEDAWQAGKSPAIDSFLARAAAESRPRLLLEMVLTELELRIKPSSQPLATHYLERFPDLLQNSATAQRIIAAEFTLRRRFVEPSLTADLYLSRLPAALGLQLQSVRDSLRALEHEPAATPPPASPFQSTQDAGNPHTGESGVPARFGEYEILEAIGQGGMGIVYRARQLGLNRIVALKRIREAEFATPDEIGRFYAEAQAAAALDHPGIVPIFEVGQLGGHPFFAMGFIEGNDLGKRLTLSPLEPPEAAQLLKSVAEAVEYAHRQGIIHRDLKPANILLDSAGQPRVTDFGLAKRLNAEHGQTQTGGLIGTACFAPPEQARYKPELVGPRSDVYSLGAILYALLTGRPPFQAASFDETIRQVIEQEPVPPRRLNPSVPLDLETIALKCLEKHPDQRYASAQAVAEELGRFINGEPILARPISRASRAIRWCQRKPVAAGLIAVATVLVLVLSIGGPVVAVREANHASALVQKNDTIQQQVRALTTSNAQAIAANDKAQKEKVRAEKTLNFVVSALRSPDPTMDGRRLKVVDLLRQSEFTAETAFKDDPILHADVLEAIQLTYSGLGVLDRALAIAIAVYEIRRKELGPNDLETLIAQNNAGSAHQALGQYGEATRLLEDALTKCRKVLGSSNALTLGVINNLATVHHMNHANEKALGLYEECLDSARREFGPNHEAVLLMETNFALSLSGMGQFKASEQLYQKVITELRDRRGADHPDTLRAMNNLAAMYHATAEYPKSLSLLIESVPKSRHRLGDGHSDTLSAMSNLAFNYRMTGAIPRAIELYKEAFDLAVQNLGPNHPTTLGIQSNWAKALHANGELERCVPVLEDCHKRRCTVLGENHPDTLVTLYGIADAYTSLKRFTESIALHEKCLAQRRDVLGDEHAATLRSIKMLADLYMMSGEFSKAIPLYDEHLAGVRKLHPPDHPLCVDALGGFAFTLSKARESALASAKWNEYYVHVRKFWKVDNDLFVCGALRAFGELLKIEEFAEAEKGLRLYAEVRDPLFPEHWSAFATKAQLGAALTGIGKLLLRSDREAGLKKIVEAESLLIAGVEGMLSRREQIPGAGKPRMLEGLEWLVILYTQLEKPEEAAKWQAKLYLLKLKSEPAKAAPR